MTQLRCVCCAKTFRIGERTTCPSCGPDDGILDVIFDTVGAARTLSRETLRTREPSVWRYVELLPIAPPNLPNSGLRTIGWTPIIEAPALANELGVGRIRLKDDGRSASGSFKDRASVVGVAMAVAAGANSIACASTGNAATSMAHCAAVAGLQANIFVARGAPEGKLAQMLAYGARVFEVEGSYDDAYQLSRQACAEFGWYDRNCAVNPYLVEGKKTAGLEIAEQCADDPPDWVAVSVGDGCTIAGIAKGLRQMRECGVIGWTTRVLGVQAEGVAPIMKALNTDRLVIPKDGTTYADSINVPVPRNWRKAVSAIRDANGAIVAVSDNEIRYATAMTGRLAGIFAEPAAAAAVAGVFRARTSGIIGPMENVVAMITGNGLKDIRGALSAIGKPTRVPADFRRIADVVDASKASAGASGGGPIRARNFVGIANYQPPSGKGQKFAFHDPVFYKCSECGAFAIYDDEILAIYTNPEAPNECATYELGTEFHCPTCQSSDSFLDTSCEDRPAIAASGWSWAL